MGPQNLKASSLCDARAFLVLISHDETQVKNAFRICRWKMCELNGIGVLPQQLQLPSTNSNFYTQPSTSKQARHCSIVKHLFSTNQRHKILYNSCFIVCRCQGWDISHKFPSSLEVEAEQSEQSSQSLDIFQNWHTWTLEMQGVAKIFKIMSFG